jgi:hypothetical protein
MLVPALRSCRYYSNFFILQLFPLCHPLPFQFRNFLSTANLFSTSLYLFNFHFSHFTFRFYFPHPRHGTTSCFHLRLPFPTSASHFHFRSISIFGFSLNHTYTSTTRIVVNRTRFLLINICTIYRMKNPNVIKPWNLILSR